MRNLKPDNQWRKLERLRMGLSAKEVIERRCLARKEVMERYFTRFWVALCSEMCSDSSLCPHREKEALQGWEFGWKCPGRVNSGAWI